MSSLSTASRKGSVYLMRHGKILRAAALAVLSVIVMQGGCTNVSEVSNKEGEQANAAVRKVMEEQQAAWNRGDIDAFMEGYAREDSITFVSGDNLTRGWQPTLERYKKTYDTPEKMGELEFSELEFKPLSPFYILVSGRFSLKRVADNPRGRFTLLFRRTQNGWRIIHDHTSSA